MPGATQHTRSVHAALTLVEETFGNITLEGDGGCKRTVSLQKEFRAHVNLASRKIESVKADLVDWRDRVRRGEVEFDAGREDDFKGAFRAFIGLSSFLVDTFDIFHKYGLYLTHPRFITLLEDHKKEVQKIVDSWRSPEWETTDERTVKWDKEQTKYLRAKLGPCN
jgi:hypothetical protein